MGGLNFKDGIIDYYLFQKKILIYMNKQKYKEDKYKLRDGYISLILIGLNIGNLLLIMKKSKNI